MSKLLVIALVLFFVIALNAKEAGEQSAPESKSESHSAKKEVDVYSKHEATLTAFQGKINSIEKEIRELLAEKNKTDDQTRVHEAVGIIKAQLKDRAENIRRYNKELHFIEYELPGKGKDFVKKYKRIEQKTVKNFEDEVNALLSDVHAKVKKKYNQENRE